MTRIVGVETVGVGLVEELSARIVEREKTREGIEVDDGNSPHVASLLDSLDVLVEEDTTGIFIHLVGLDVLLARAEISTVDRRHHNDLLGGIHLLEFRHGDVDAALERVLVHDEVAVTALHHFTRFVACHFHTVESFCVPFAFGHAIVEIVGAHEDEDGVEVIAMFSLEFVGLAGNVVPLSSAYPVDVGRDAEPLLQESPVFHL